MNEFKIFMILKIILNLSDLNERPKSLGFDCNPNPLYFVKDTRPKRIGC
jgi:hypothetical protein